MDRHTRFRNYLLAAGITTVLGPAAAQAAPRYGVADLGVIDLAPPINSFSQVLSVNDSGLAAGFAFRRITSQLRAVSADAANAPLPAELPSLGGSHAQAMAINAAGDLAGSAFLSGDAAYHAALWKQDQVTDLGTLGGSNSRARAINDSGDVVGASSLAGIAAEHAVLWSGGKAIDLGTMGGPNSLANGVNAARQVTGYAALANGQQHAFLWQGTGLSDLGTLGGNYSEGHAINDAGDVAGYATTAGDGQQHAALWRAGSPIQDLGTLGGSYSEAFSINASGQIVGTSTVPGDQNKRGFLYENGMMADLNTLIPAGTGFSIVDAYGISPAGLIAGVARVGVEFHAVVLVPDRTPPQITCPASINAATQPASLGTAVATDELDPAPTVTSNAPQPLAVNAMTLVTWIATDGAGNKAQCTQLVTVGTPPPGSTPIQPPPTSQDPPVPETPVLPPATDPGAPGSPGNPSDPGIPDTPTTPGDPGNNSPQPPGDTGSTSGATPIAASGARLLLDSQLLKPTAKKIRLGAKLVFRMRVVNTGMGAASGINMLTPLSGKLSFRNATASQGSCTAPAKHASRLGGTVTCDLGDLAAGQELWVEITAQARKRGAVVNSGMVSMAGGSPTASELRVKVR